MDIRIEIRRQCMLVFGGIPMNKFEALTALAPEGSHVIPRLAKAVGANFAFARPEDANALMEELTPSLLAEAAKRHQGAGLSVAAIEWLATGERGTSSETIFEVLSGIKVLEGGDSRSHPLDPDDFRRCRLLLEQVPEFQVRIGEMAAESKEWAGLASRWQEICELMDAECGWPPRPGSVARRTYDAIRQARGERN